MVSAGSSSIRATWCSRFWEYIEYLSRDLTLYPGDIISGGTAAGTAADFKPADG